MKRCLFVFALALFFLQISAQHRLEWLNVPYMPNGMNQSIDDMVTDPAGNIYTQQVIYPVNEGETEYCYVEVVKQDIFGNQLWATVISDTFQTGSIYYHLLYEQNGSIYTTFYDYNNLAFLKINETSGAVDTVVLYPCPAALDSSPGPIITGYLYQGFQNGVVKGYDNNFYCFTQYYDTSNTITIIKADTAGLLQHYAMHWPVNTALQQQQIFTDQNGNIYLDYYVDTSQTYQTTYGCKINADGSIGYYKQLCGAGCYGTLITADRYGNTFWLSSASNEIMKMDTGLNQLWSYHLQAGQYGNSMSGVLDAGSNLYIESNNSSDNLVYCTKLLSNGQAAFSFRLPSGFTGPTTWPVQPQANGDVYFPNISFIDATDPDYISHKQAIQLVVCDSNGGLEEQLSDTVFYTLVNFSEIFSAFADNNGNEYFAQTFLNYATWPYPTGDTILNNMLDNLWYTAKLCTTCGTGAITGLVKIDSVATCNFDSVAPAGQNSMVYLTPGTRAAAIDNTGAYRFDGASPGIYTVSVVPPPYLFTGCDSTYPFNIDSVTQPVNHNFNLVAQSGCNVQLNINGTRARVGRVQRTDITYYNTMYQPVSGELAVTLDSLFIFDQASPAPDSSSGSTYFWRFSNDGPYYPNTVHIYSTVTVVDSYEVNMFRLTAAVYCNCSAPGVATATDTLTDYLYDSFDPNQKTVSPLINRFYNAFISKSQPLTFQIDFENTGNDTAFRVIVRDTIDPGFDLRTLKMIAASAPCQFTIGPNRDVAFTLNNIQLPDSSASPDSCAGYVVYSITPDSSLSLGQQVSNRASIYFDFNPPVVTNTVTLTYLSKFPLSVNNLPAEDYLLTIYPNPASDQLYIKTENIQPASIIIYDADGRMIYTMPFTPTVNVNGLSSGVYFVEVTSNEGVARKRFVKM